MNTRILLFSIPATALVISCGDANSPGIEYMPDMYRGPSVEAYVDYGQDPYYFGDSVAEAERNTPGWRLPPEGTIAFAADAKKAEFNFPYPYPNTTEGYEEAGLDLHSPVAMTAESVEKGKDIYTKFCIHCHGETGQGDGPVVSRGGHPPPTAYSGPLKDLPEGKMFHTLTYGKGMMGSHASQLSKEERWTVIQYVKYLQAGGKMPGASTDSTATTAARVMANTAAH